MKKLFLLISIIALSVACRASGANMHDSSCTGKDCAECTEAQKENCQDCKGEKAECKAEGQVCPVTGKSMN